MMIFRHKAIYSRDTMMVFRHKACVGKREEEET